MRRIWSGGLGLWLAVLLTSCSGANKQEIGLSADQVYRLQSSGKMTVYPSQSAEGARGAQPLHKLRVKRKNEAAGAKTEGCWACTDCICHDDECTCSECSSC